MTNDMNRRPLKTRDYAWTHKLAHDCVGLGITPNQMSLASIAAAAFGALFFWGSTIDAPFLRFVFLFLAALCIQLRLLSNMLDGLMAVEEGGKTPTGVLYNEFPDRVADIIFLVAAGYAAGCPALGWACALLAVLTAYIRAFGASLGYEQDYCGPMAKPHRMFALTVGTLLAAFLPHQPILMLALIVILLGGVATVVRRTHHIVVKLS